MTNQPILDELHAVREQLLADAGGTLAGLVARIQEDQKTSTREIRKSQKPLPCSGAGNRDELSPDNLLSPQGNG